MINALEVFPVRFFETAFPNATDVLQEVALKRKEIKVVSAAHRAENNHDYITDFEKPVKIDAFEQGFSLLQESMNSQGLKAELMHYWTALYKRNGSHGVHEHRSDILDRTNYSGVLHLSNLGGTTFFAPAEPCFNKELLVQSKFGNVTMFPASLLHAYAPGNAMNSAERIIMSFNVRIEAL